MRMRVYLRDINEFLLAEIPCNYVEQLKKLFKLKVNCRFN